MTVRMRYAFGVPIGSMVPNPSRRTTRVAGVRERMRLLPEADIPIRPAWTHFVVNGPRYAQVALGHVKVRTCATFGTSLRSMTIRCRSVKHRTDIWLFKRDPAPEQVVARLVSADAFV